MNDALTVARLIPAIAVTCFLPGYLVLKLAWPALSASLDRWERAPLVFGLSMGAWTIVTALAYPVHASTGVVLISALGAEAAGLAALVLPAVGARPTAARAKASLMRLTL